MTAGTRRRGDALQRAIFDAVLAQLASAGYDGLTMEGVAAAARTGKAALYRRWSGKDELVLDALRGTLPSPADLPLCDDLRADLLTVLRSLRDGWDAAHGTAFRVFKEATDPGKGGPLHTLIRERVSDPARAVLLDILRRAAERGEIRPDAVTDQVARVGPAMLSHHYLTEGPGVPDEYVASVVDNVLLPLVRR